MVKFKTDRLQTIFNAFAGKRIAVIGDLMLDRYFWGTVSRLSPEAPVPIVEVEEESVRLGGAANVANNIASLGGTPLLVGVVGNDSGAEFMRSLVKEKKFPATGLVVDATRPTTMKTRVIAHNQHVVRVDQETKNDISQEIEHTILHVLKNDIDSIDGIILEDYNKGVMTNNLIKEVVRLAAAHKKVVTVDPKFNNFFEYHGVTVFKPNRKEMEEAIGRKLHDFDEMKLVAFELLKKIQAKNILLTLGDKGMMLVEESGDSAYVETKARTVADVSGAGDTVIATLTMALVAGASVREAAMLANYAGGIVCGEVGIVPIDKNNLFDTIIEEMNGSVQ
ncbi:MAG TPA: D-glycero-beta-D-manno-heptose-7-phosphate kinase [Bacteroidota bacterium]|nr:D-glycero-beta-D-manno-heptose-7-phosphate kinase [Bacteroidota bacterium]